MHLQPVANAGACTHKDALDVSSASGSALIRVPAPDRERESECWWLLRDARGLCRPGSMQQSPRTRQHQSTCMPHIFMHKWARATGHLVYRPSTRREFEVSYEVMHDVFDAFSSTFLRRAVHWG